MDYNIILQHFQGLNKYMNHIVISSNMILIFKIFMTYYIRKVFVNNS